MATLAETMRSDMLTVFLNTDEHAVPLVYTPLGGSARNIDGVFDPIEDIDAQPMQDGQHVTRTATVKIYDTGSTDGVTTPALGDSVYVNLSGHPLNAVVFKVKRCQPDGHGMHDLYVVREDNREKSVENYRIQRGR